MYVHGWNGYREMLLINRFNERLMEIKFFLVSANYNKPNNVTDFYTEC